MKIAEAFFTDLIDIQEAARRSGLALSTLARLTSTGEISSVRVGLKRQYDPKVLRQELIERYQRLRKPKVGAK